MASNNIGRSVLRENYDILIDHLPAEDLTVKLYGVRMLTDREKSEIQEGVRIRSEKAEKLVDALMRRGDSGLDALCEVLDASRDVMCNNLGKALGGDADKKPLLKELISVKVTDRWYELGLYLDLDQIRLDEIKSDERSVAERRLAMFKEWLLMDEKATWRHLINALEKLQLKGVVKDLIEENRLGM